MQWRGAAAGREVPEEDGLGAGIPEVEIGQEEDIRAEVVDTRVAEADIQVADAREDNKEDRMALSGSRHRILTRGCPEQTILLSLT
jgi:predicted NUDIX family NTP pyrophosphohydrolase